MLGADKDDVEEQTIVIKIPDRYKDGVAVESPDILANLDINKDEIKDKDGKDDDDNPLKKNCIPHHQKRNHHSSIYRS